MKQQFTIFALLFFTIVGTAACSVPGSSEPQVEAPTASENEGNEDAAPCPEAPAGAYRLSDGVHGICLHYPDQYEVFATDDGGFTLYVDSLLNTEAPIASFEFEPANGRAIEEILGLYLPDVDFSTVRLQTVGLDGETGYILDNLPGQDTNRRVIAIRDDLVINIMVARIGEAYGAVGQEAEALFDMITGSLRLIDIDPSAPLLANGEVIDRTSSDNDGGIDPVTSFDETIAYVQDQTLFIQPKDGAPIATESCLGKTYCKIQYLKWSPDGHHLLYYLYDDTVSSLRIVDTVGHIQSVTENGAFILPGDWAPDGHAIAFLVSTDTYIEGTETSPPYQVHEVWTAVLDEGGTLNEAVLVGETNRMADGCGGGGRSVSEVLYEDEGGTSYGYLMGVLEWTASDILLYTSNCTNIGMNRFDMKTATDLPGFDATLRNLVMAPDNSRWYAVVGPTWKMEGVESHQIATGVAQETAVDIIPTSNPVELVFVGPVSGKLYYTTREFVDDAEIADVSAYFNYFKSALWQINSDGSDEKLLWSSDDQAYAQLTELKNGDILFVLVENDRPLYDALLNGEASLDEMGQYAPQRHVIRLAASGGEPQMMIRNAGQPELTP